jgi:predicted RNase H-like HicB family nuclease
MIFHVTLETSADGWIVAECPALPGGVSQGRDDKEALDNIKEAIIACALGRRPENPGEFIAHAGWSILELR